ncbi:MAG: DUF3084 domain-containing protein [Chthonomonas sp.]|nr:DUF3084 domain-containing protein [Chthonomonas sp.]
MDLFGGLVVLGFCVVGAIVALFADNLGRKLGKKRLSLFKLRPRHTATLLTGAAGFSIPLVTVLLMALASGEVRTILREGSQLRAQRDVARQSLNKATSDLTSKTSEVEARQKEIGVLGGQVKTTQSKLEASNKEIAAKVRQAMALTGKVSRLQGQLGKFQRDFGRISAQVRVLKPQLVRAKAEYADLQQRTKIANVQLTSVNGELRAVNTRATELDLQNTQLERSIKAKEGEIKDLTARQTQIQKEFDLARQQYDLAIKNLDQERGKLTDELGQLQGQFDALSRDVEDLQTISQGLQANAQSARTKSLIVARFDELARLRIQPGLTAEEARIQVESALVQARRETQKLGAKPDANGLTANLVQVQFRDTVKTPDEQVADAIKAITGSKDQMVVLVNSLFNAFQDESVPVLLQVRKNPVVFKPGDVIAEARIDGSKSDDQVVQELTTFFTKDLRDSAVKKGMIAAIGRPLGEVGPEQLIQLVQDVRSTQRRLRVIAVATRETRAADTLVMEFRYR